MSTWFRMLRLAALSASDEVSAACITPLILECAEKEKAILAKERYGSPRRRQGVHLDRGSNQNLLRNDASDIHNIRPR